jgi:hypothetical protein
MADVFGGVLILVGAAVFFWKASLPRRLMQQRKGGRIIAALIGIAWTLLGIMAIRQGLNGK